jgi:hypothetical protein
VRLEMAGADCANPERRTVDGRATSHHTNSYSDLPSVALKIRHLRTYTCIRRDVAQPGSALAWGARGRQFKSGRPDQFFQLLGAIRVFR